jgi:uncharacterized sulfatase
MAKVLPMTMKPGESEPGKIWGDAERLGGPVEWRQRSTITGGFIEAAIPFMERAVAAKKPFYVNLWPDDVHSPFWPPVDQWADGKRGLYRAVLMEADRQLGKLFDHIRNNPALRDNTLILICSDNGPEPGAGSAGPFRGTKGTLYEGGIRVPAIVRIPGLVPAGSVCDVPAVTMDLPATFLDLAGVSLEGHDPLDGTSLMPLLRDPKAAFARDTLFWHLPHYHHSSPASAIRQGDWKLIEFFEGGEIELYDLSSDLGESKNLAVANPDKTTELREALGEWRTGIGARLPVPNPDHDPVRAGEKKSGMGKRGGPE